MKRTCVTALLLAGALAASAQDTGIYQQGGATLDAVSEALKSAQAAAGLPAPVGPTIVAGTQSQAVADVQAMEKKGVKFFYAVGTSASTLAAQNSTSSGIYVFVPNPSASGLAARPRWSGVSPYPDPRAVMAYLRDGLGVQRVGLLYTKKSNQEVAKIFEDAAAAEKLAVRSLGLGDAGDLQGVLGPAVKDIGALLLLIDPVSFSPDSIRYVISACLEAKRPCVGFLDASAKMGVPLALYPTSDDLARTAVAAMQALRQKNEDRKIWYSPHFVLSVNEGALASLGIRVDPAQIANKY